jgi:hypothetical protein
MRVLLTRFVAGAFFFAADTVLAVVAFLAVVLATAAFFAGIVLAGAATAATFFAGAAEAAETLITGTNNEAVMSAAV